MIKKYSGHIIGFLSSIVFFMTLAYIVKPSSESLKNENSFRVVDFIRLKKDTSLKEKSNIIKNEIEIVFIVGMPRCGSTLLETILSLNSDVNDMGEVFFLEESIRYISEFTLIYDSANSRA